MYSTFYLNHNSCYSPTMLTIFISLYFDTFLEMLFIDNCYPCIKDHFHIAKRTKLDRFSFLTPKFI